MLKQIQFITVSFILFLYSSFAVASEELTLLNAMSKKVRSANYEVMFVYDNFINSNTLLLRHSLIGNEPFSQLLFMDGVVREILQQGDTIAYFQQDSEPFSLKSQRIIEGLPAIVYSDFEQLSQYYSFIPAGYSRVSNQICKVIRIVDKNNERYMYILWIDEKNAFPLRIDLVDQQSNILEQVKVILFKQNNGINAALDAIRKMEFPPVMAVPNALQKSFDWTVSWLPAGFKEISSLSRGEAENAVESRFYSDGLFSVSVYVSPLKNKLQQQTLKQGTKVIYLYTKNDREILVVGELPKETIKQIANSIRIEQ